MKRIRRYQTSNKKRTKLLKVRLFGLGSKWTDLCWGPDMAKSGHESRVGPESRSRLGNDYIIVTMESHDKKVVTKS